MNLVILPGSNIKAQNDSIQVYHGKKIIDKYSYLQNLKDSSVIKWFEQQNKEASTFLDLIDNRERLDSLQRYFLNQDSELITNIKSTFTDDFYYLKQEKNGDHIKLFRKDAKSNIEELIFDLQEYNGVHNSNYTITYYKPSWNSEKVVIGMAEKGKEISKLRFLDTKTKEFFPDEIENTLPTFGGVYWLPKNNGVTFLQLGSEKEKIKDYLQNTQVVVHKLGKGTLPLFSKENNPNVNFKTEDIPVVFRDRPLDKYLVAAVAGATKYYEYYYTIVKDNYIKDKAWHPLFRKEDKVLSYLQQNDSIIYLTSKDASNFKLCKTSLSPAPDVKSPKILVKEFKDKVITKFAIVKDNIFFTTLKNGVDAKLYKLRSNGEIEQMELPLNAGNITLETKGLDDSFFAIKLTGWTFQERRFIYNFENNFFKESNIKDIKNFKISNTIKVEEIEVKAQDGELIPLSLIYRNDLKKDGQNSTFLTGYGSYGYSIKPSFSKKIMTWVHEGGVYAIAHVRGGGEKGDYWYKGGLKATKANTWKDFIATAEYLIKEKYTSKSKLAISGGSAGGITVGRAMTEKPDLFAGVIAHVPFMNTILMETDINGANSTKEFGTIKSKEEFNYLYEMDSFHHVEKGTSYPATLVTTGFNDIRVPSWDPAKFYAKLKDYNSSNNPLLFSVDFDSGHDGGNSISKSIKNTTDALAFAFWSTEHPTYTLKNT
ncbi:prolyl oligopeptidase family serine peptidase [Aquimarina sp. ERC-38]|uniref:prolyl oligopeptidase family serine peptidase n=1 Tax=Aquimarina sp. ERC-38 TaxID=2949996 RepID=UPI0022451202|nr:prolyl oligopeptidase family serine peptidase [Aquimarina sp. ERC-38]UZO82105.1 prolyl oligopeptidase family serine peptidase [Aquimarina sp. ERC-38]